MVKAVVMHTKSGGGGVRWKRGCRREIRGQGRGSGGGARNK